MNYKLLIPIVLLSLLLIPAIVMADDPWAGYVPTSLSGAAPLTVSFTDITYGTPTSWAWYFKNVTGDNAPHLFSSDQNPTYTFGYGNYSIWLTATNSFGVNTTPSLAFVNVTGSGYVDFYANATTGSTPLQVKFYDASTTNPVTWSWAYKSNVSGSVWTLFTQSTLQNPVQVFTTGSTARLYDINLTTTGALGYTNSTIKTTYITVSPAGYAPVTSFSANATSGMSPLAVGFTDSSTNTPLNWAWYWYANETVSSTLQNPTASLAAGTYNVRLYSSNYNGGDWENKTAYISVIPSITAPVANFVADTTYGEAPLTVHFTDLSTNAPDHWQWTISPEMGVLGYFLAQNPTLVFPNPGTYTIVLTASNSGGSDDENKVNYITVIAPTATPTPSPTPTTTTPTPTAEPTPIPTSDHGPQILAVNGVTSNNADLAIEATPDSEIWIEWGQNRDGYTWRTENVTTDSYGNATGRIWGAPLMGSTSYWATACSDEGCGNEVQFSTDAITPIPTSSYGAGYRNLTQSHFNIMMVAPAILTGYFAIVPATIFWTILLGILVIGIWRRNRSVRLVSLVMIILSPMIMSAGTGLGLGVVGGAAALGQALLAAGLAGMLLSFIKK